MLQELKNGTKVVGVKQTKRALGDGSAKKVFLAADADPALQDVVRALCEEKQIPAVEVPSMKELGRACSIAVGAAVAAIVQAEKP